MRGFARAAVKAGAMLAIVPAVAGAIAVLALAPAARADTAYRYWTYWSVVDGAWRFSTIGPASAVPPDGAVEGWRFTIATAIGSAGDAPDRSPADAFESICGDTPAVPGKKRVALAVDFGMPEEAPAGERSPADIRECVVGDADATGYELLRSITDVRVADGLVCGIESYPLVECAELVDGRPTSSPGMVPLPESITAAAQSTSSTGPLISALALLAAAVIGLLAWRGRGRR